MVQTIDLRQINNRCINATSRRERKKYMQKVSSDLKFRFEFYPAIMRRDTKRGCLESHLEVIQLAYNRGWDKVAIFEDDLFATTAIRDASNWTLLQNVPDDWDMLYLGGTVKQKLYDEADYTNYVDFQNREWVRMCCWTTHAYIINLRNFELVADIAKASEQNQQIDHYYLEKIHPKYRCYMHNPMYFTQKEGLSDVEHATVNYDFMESTLEGFPTPQHRVLDDGSYVLKLDPTTEDELPRVSIVTPTRNRRKLFPIAIRNFQNFQYPANKIEWVIVDDTPIDDDTVEDILPKGDTRIKYCRLRLEQPMTVAAKRNWGVRESTAEYILHMDDDDYYPPESVLSRVKLLMKYRSMGIQCVGCSRYGTYDVIQNKSSMASDGSLSLSEASMAYLREFWNERGFDETAKRGEYWGFIRERLHRVMDVPYVAVFYGLTHKTNLTGDMRKTVDTIQFRDTQQEANYFDMWDDETQEFINYIRRAIDPTLPRLLTAPEKKREAEQQEHDQRQKEAEANLQKKVKEGKIKMVNH
jgi:hypothetical protein